MRSLIGVVLMALALVLFAGSATAQSDDYEEQPTSSVRDSTTVPEASVTSAVEAAQVSSSDLPVTGSDLATLAIVGVVLLAAGGVLVTARRRSVT